MPVYQPGKSYTFSRGLISRLKISRYGSTIALNAQRKDVTSGENTDRQRGHYQLIYEGKRARSKRVIFVSVRSPRRLRSAINSMFCGYILNSLTRYFLDHTKLRVRIPDGG